MSVLVFVSLNVISMHIQIPKFPRGFWKKASFTVRKTEATLAKAIPGFANPKRALRAHSEVELYFSSELSNSSSNQIDAKYCSLLGLGIIKV